MIIKKIDKKHLIAILRALQDNYINIIFHPDSNEITIKDSKTVTTIKAK